MNMAWFPKFKWELQKPGVGWFGLFCFFVSLNALKLADGQAILNGICPVLFIANKCDLQERKAAPQVMDFGCLTVEFVTKW